LVLLRPGGTGERPNGERGKELTSLAKNEGRVRGGIVWGPGAFSLGELRVIYTSKKLGAQDECTTSRYWVGSPFVGTLRFEAGVGGGEAFERDVNKCTTRVGTGEKRQSEVKKKIAKSHYERHCSKRGHLEISGRESRKTRHIFRLVSRGGELTVRILRGRPFLDLEGTIFTLRIETDNGGGGKGARFFCLCLENHGVHSVAQKVAGNSNQQKTKKRTGRGNTKHW